jgi:hypothetical protein
MFDLTLELARSRSEGSDAKNSRVRARPCPRFPRFARASASLPSADRPEGQASAVRLSPGLAHTAGAGLSSERAKGGRRRLANFRIPIFDFNKNFLSNLQRSLIELSPSRPQPRDGPLFSLMIVSNKNIYIN